MLRHIAFFIAFTFSHFGLCATVQSVKNEKMLILLNGQIVKAGERFFLLDANGKKKALIRIRQVKDDRAVAEVIKGAVQTGYNLSSSPSSPPAEETQTKESKVKAVSKKSYTRVRPQEGNSWGVLGSLLQNQMQADFIPSGSSTKTSVAMKGTSFGALGFYDYSYSPEIQFRGLAGLEMFNASGTGGATDCSGSSDCNVNITYLSAYGGVKYNFYRQKINLWAGGYYGFLFALSKASSVFKTADISSNQLWVFSGGLDYPLSKKTFIPVSLDYGIFPSSATVKSNIIYIRAGWGTLF